MADELQAYRATMRGDLKFARSCERAAMQMARLDERLSRMDAPIRRGMIKRFQYQEAQSFVGLSGGFLHLSDFILYDHNMQVQLASLDMQRGRVALHQLKKASVFTKQQAFEVEVLAEVLDLPPSVLTRTSITVDEAIEDDLADAIGGIDELLTKRSPDHSIGHVLKFIEDLPAVMGACVLFDALRLREARSGFEFSAALLPALFLRSRDFARSCLPTLCHGLYRGARRWQHHDELAWRLLVIAEAFTQSADLALAYCDRVTLAHMGLINQAEKKSRNTSHLQMIELLIEEPLVTIDMAAKRLDKTPQAVSHLIRSFGEAMPQELTGRKHYRAWGVF